MSPTRILSIFILCTFLFFLSCKKADRLPVYYLVLSDQLSAEHQTACDLIAKPPFSQFQILPLSQVASVTLPKGIIWLHIPDSTEYARWMEVRDKLDFLHQHYEHGGKILFTDFAANLPYELGMETVKPETRILNIQDAWLFDKKGLQSFRGHPVFLNLFGGTFIWDAFEDHTLPITGFFEQNYPANGKVVAVEKSYITIHANNKVMIEYRHQDGKILSIGGFIYLSRPNHARLHLEKFLLNCFDYLSGITPSAPITYWEKYDHRPRPFTIRTSPLHPPISRQVNLPSADDMLIQQSFATQNYYDVSGERALVMGKEAGGIDELWVHPFRVVRDWEVGILQGDSVEWLKKIPARLEVRPESFTRHYSFPAGNLTEIIYPALHLPGAIIHYKWGGKTNLKLLIKYRSDLRWMWPYDEHAIGDVYYAFDPALNALHVHDSAGDLYAVIGADWPPLLTSSGQFSDLHWRHGTFQTDSSTQNHVCHAGWYELSPENNFQLNCGIVGTNTGQQHAVKDYHKLLLQPQKIYDEARDYYSRLLKEMVTIESPDPEFNKLWKWAIVGTEKFLAYTPGVGTALLAGYSTTARGWRGGHKISGRPGYAWYFGRDSEWSGFAIDDYGHLDVVKTQLDFLQKFQDLSGKIFHEISTSGVVHFDAADATPLYIILAAHYLRASGDLPFIEKSWPHLEKAMNYLYSTDTDGDLLIENTNEGHGWVEGGELFGAHTTFYLASLWAQTLRDASYIARHLQKKDQQQKYDSDYRKVREILHTEFWNESTKFFNYGKFKDGTFNPEPTVLPAVAMYFQLLDPSRVHHMLANYAGNGFSPDWGVRIVSSQSKLFVPTGYHYGSVWPLFTGWTSLAEFAYGHSVQGFTHLMNNLLIKNYWTLGYVEEVMNGAVYKPAGVCPHQCWSETNILHPGVHGMIGWQPRALEREAILTPRFPLHWDTLRVNNLRVGNSLLDFIMTRKKTRTSYRFILKKGQPIKLHFAPERPAGMVIRQILMDNTPIFSGDEKQSSGCGDTLHFVLSKEKILEYEHQAGIGVIPYISRPLPEDSSAGYRIIADTWQESHYTLELEGASDTFADFVIHIFDQQVQSIENAEILSLDDKGLLKIRVRFPTAREKYSKTSVRIFL